MRHTDNIVKNGACALATFSSLERVSRSGRKFWLGEVTGALGDIGTFLPIVIGLTQLVGMDPGTILVMAGLANIATGLIFRLPIAVQPMKAIAALAIAGQLTAGQAYAAGLVTALTVLTLAGLGLIRWLDRIIPRAVISGVQLAVGLKLMSAAVRTLRSDPWVAAVADRTVVLVMGVLLVAAVLIHVNPHNNPWLLLGFLVLGFVWANVHNPVVLASPIVTLWQPTWVDWGPDMWRGVQEGVLAQLPLTLLNSVFAVSVLTRQLFPNPAGPSGPGAIACSVGIMNLVSIPLGGMPVCHGSGGLAAQYGCGARSGWSVVFLGLFKLTLGLFFSGVVLAWLIAFPKILLGFFLLNAGLCLARVSRFWNSLASMTGSLMTVSVYFATGLLPLGFAAGWIVDMVIKHQSWGSLQLKELS
jgi:hypothetical protein